MEQQDGVDARCSGWNNKTVTTLDRSWNWRDIQRRLYGSVRLVASRKRAGGGGGGSTTTMS